MVDARLTAARAARASLLGAVLLAPAAAAQGGPAPLPEPPDPALAAVRQALESTAARPFAYTVNGRFKRTGIFQPPDLLTARIAAYRSARRGTTILVKGPEGLWRTPSEHLGETVLGAPPPRGLADMIRILEAAEPPQDLIRQLLDGLSSGTAEADTPVNGVACRVYAFAIPKNRLREDIERQMEKERARGETPAPDQVRWETLRGHLRVYVSRTEGLLVRAVESRSVRVVFGGDDRTYRNVLSIDFAEHGTAVPELPDEVRVRLGTG